MVIISHYQDAQLLQYITLQGRSKELSFANYKHSSNAHSKTEPMNKESFQFKQVKLNCLCKSLTYMPKLNQANLFNTIFLFTS